MRGHIRRRGNKWVVVVDIGRDANGKRIQKWHSGFSRRKEAEQALTEILGRIQSGTYVEPNRLTLSRFVSDEWLPTIQRSLRPSTFESYRGNLVRHIEPRLGPILLRNLTGPMLTGLYGELLDGKGEDRKPLAPRTVRYIHTILRRALADAVKWNRLAHNPADVAEPPPPRRAKPEIIQTWSADQLRAFLDHVREDRLHAAWRLAATTGLRRGELLGLRWRDLDLDVGRASIVQTLIAGKGAPQISSPKTDTGRRSIAVDGETTAALRAHRKAQARERLAFGPGYREGGLVFCREDGAPIWPRTLSRSFARHAKSAGLPIIRFHDLRHTHATLALQAGIHPKVVSERLGHANIGITLDTYSHAIPAMQEDAAMRVAALLRA